MRRTHILIAATAALLLTGACSGKKDKKDAQAQATPTVAVAEPEVDSVTLHREFPGFIQAATKVDVVARVNGTLRGYNYAPGQYVRKGQVLFTIESTTYADAVQRAQGARCTASQSARLCRQAPDSHAEGSDLQRREPDGRDSGSGQSATGRGGN